MVDLEQLEHLLKVAAKTRQPLTYAEILSYFERQTTPITVRALCSDLGKVGHKMRSEGWPELACLVVRKSDRLPGEGYFDGAVDEAGKPVPHFGPEAAAYVLAQQVKAYAHAEAVL